MPGLIASDDAGRKRKRVSTRGASKEAKSRKAPKPTNDDDPQSKILLLEEQILQSRENYNNIVELQKIVDHADKKPKTATIAAVALCRVFCRLIAGESLVKQAGASEGDSQVVQWLRARLDDYLNRLTSWIGSPDATKESTALTLLMRIVKEEATNSDKGDRAWRHEKSAFVAVVSRLLQETEAEGARQEFVEKFVEEHHDVRFYTFVAVKQILQDVHSGRQEVATNAIDLLIQIEGVPESDDQLEDWYGSTPQGQKNQLLSLTAHRKVARQAWLSIFRSTLSQESRKKMLSVATGHILPWFAGHIELLTDFLTDSFNQGGAMSLLALSGIFKLMTQKNIDYADFYTKLYSLLDEDLLHSKHRSRFFRMFETFMTSSHLPAAMVASFIKRLSRLSLQAPPGAIVWVVPWTYNMLKQHPPCTFMLHRTYHPAHAIYATHPNYEDQGMDDPFDMKQKDPMVTGAIDSSLWELETLQSHYHPNVATLAKIMGEQFTKKDYQLEDFLDHTSQTLIDAELGKEVKKPPVVEWELPKRIVTTEDGGMNDIGKSLQTAIDNM
ncbi:hypothetical protein M409DRAFT_17722 [Zasmidium cellare ATCC 36951]|uniref:CCAAT-binding factor domain-containing protein n=1 Tax=Zasmidium cellare ATCC 36951 TaxID=1080233 RepID=A0A6A6D246_ZASCE|nr:uncharacterized protein M409DRAFT_17722 [Zasmidium cellare ATCC 36951]KAF2172488.1 hypothetical protein M409DRAFT_17722 [Zasmidium cellare ATCC 36951]